MLPCQRDQFDLPDGIHYLNCATLSPNLHTAIAAGTKAILRKSRPHEITPTHFFTDAAETRQLFAQLINCPDRDRIALIPSVSYGMATVAKNLAVKPGLRAGQEILTIFEEFPSDVYAWDEVCADKGLVVKTISPPATSQHRGADWNARLLEAITANTSLVVLPHVHWTDGTRFDLVALRQRTQAVGAWLVIDGSQSMGALPFDVQAIQPDALITAGYKTLLGPYGMGLAYWGETFDEGRPLEANWINKVGSDNFGGLANYQRAFRPKAARYNMGEQSNFILLPMLNAALQHLLTCGIANIQAYCGSLVTDVVPALRNQGFWIEEADWRSHHLFGIRDTRTNGPGMAAIKASLAQHQISASVRSDAIRVSVNTWNTPDDLAALVQAL